MSGLSANFSRPHEMTAELEQLRYLVFEGLAGKAPRVNATNNHWEVYDNDTQAWVDTGVEATGAKGDDGYTPVVTASETMGGVFLTISDGRPGGVINTYFIRDGTNGAEGLDGHSPYINSTGYWVFWNDSTGAWVTTNYKAAGRDGTDGHSPYIGANGHWFAWDESLEMFDDTGVSAQGASGYTPTVTADEVTGGVLVTVEDGRPAGTIHTAFVRDGDPGPDGYSPEVTVTSITGGHRVTITDGEHPQGQSFDVMDGEDGIGADSVVYLSYDSMFDDDPAITVTSSNPSYATAATIAPALANDTIRSVRFADDYTFDVYDLVGYSSATPATLTFACVKDTQIKFAVMTGTSGKPVYSSVPISGGSGSDDIVIISIGDDGEMSYNGSVITGGYVAGLAASGKTVIGKFDYSGSAQNEFRLLYLSEYYDDPGGEIAFTGIVQEDGAYQICTAIAQSDEDTLSIGYYRVLPAVSNSDAGKVLTVNSSGQWAAQTPSGGSTPFVIPITRIGQTYTTTATAEDILAHADNCVVDMSGSIIYSVWYNVKSNGCDIAFEVTSATVEGYIENTTINITVRNGTVTVGYFAGIADALPPVSATDNGKSLVVDNGAWTASTALQTKSITDTGNYYTTDTVEGALQEIGAELAGVNTLIGSGVIT